MHFRSRLPFCAAVVFLVGCFEPEVYHATPDVSSASARTKAIVRNQVHENFKTAMAEAIGILEAEDYKRFVETFAPPGFLEQKSAEPGGIDAWIQEVSRRGPDILIALKDVEKSWPPMLEPHQSKHESTRTVDGKSVTVRFVFKKTDKYWYIEH